MTVEPEASARTCWSAQQVCKLADKASIRNAIKHSIAAALDFFVNLFLFIAQP
jgi:hypothetical protein